MTNHLRAWLTRKWQPVESDTLTVAYRATFSTLYGQQVLQHLMDQVYCQICSSLDPIELATHNGRRSVIQELLDTLDRAESPKKYEPQQEVPSWRTPSPPRP